VCSEWPTSWSNASGRSTATTQRTGAKLLEPTSDGRRALGRLTVAQHAWADMVGNAVGEDELRRALAVLRQVIESSRAYRERQATVDR
jgi:hypothetical protein